MLTLTRRVRRIALALLPALALMTPARAGAVGCAGQSLAQTFLPWTDPAWYTPLPDSGFEWTFVGSRFHPPIARSKTP